MNEIVKETEHFLILKEKETTIYQSMQGIMKVVLREAFVAINAYVKKEREKLK